ncbi:MAG: alpha/beta fold hydrolase [Verrucomicrobia bacterium]|nr:alpha/beta fold hydrolase [Verrucomicrobiota bacterium]
MPLLAAGLAVTGCTPSGFIARQLIRAPSSFPRAVAPEPRVYYTFPEEFLTEVPPQVATVGTPPVSLAYRVVPPAAYALQMVRTRHPSASGTRPFFRFTAEIPGAPTPFTDRPRGTVVLLHGYALDQDSMVPWALLLADAGWRCVLVDLRGHGASGGDRIHFGLQESRDLTALMDELVRRREAGWPAAVVGVSYGAAVALRWATEDSRVHPVVAITPYARLGDAVEGLRSEYADWVPAGLLGRAVASVPALLGAGPGDLDPVTWLHAGTTKALWVAAEDDVVAPPGAVQELQAASAPESRYLELHGVTHELAPFQVEELQGPLRDWLDAEEAGEALNRTGHQNQGPSTADGR